MEKKAGEIRLEIIKMLTNAGSGHTAGPLGSADFWATLYFGGKVAVKPDNPWWEDRDRVVLSAGHYAPVLYASLALAGFFDQSELLTLRQLGSRLQGHPINHLLPGVEISSGSLGQGASQAVGMALAGKIMKKRWRVICFMGDGEQDEGQVWEAYVAAAKYKLANLTFVVDRNNIQLDGFSEEIWPMEPLTGKYEAFNLWVREVDGHSVSKIGEAIDAAALVPDKPQILVLHTTPGKGISFMENQFPWHGKVPKIGEAVEALMQLREIRTLSGKVSYD